METTKLTVVALLLISILSCSDDYSNTDVTDNAQNILSIDGQEFLIKSATITDYGPEPFNSNGHDFDIAFYSQEVSFVNGEAVIDGDKYSYIYFDLITDSSDNIDLGVYSLRQDLGQSKSFNGDTGLDQESDTTSPSNDNRAQLVSGVLQVLDNNSTNYKFEYNGMDGLDRDVSLEYEGSLLKLN